MSNFRKGKNYDLWLFGYVAVLAIARAKSCRYVAYRFGLPHGVRCCPSEWQDVRELNSLGMASSMALTDHRKSDSCMKALRQTSISQGAR